MSEDKQKPMHWKELEKTFEEKQSIILFLGTGVNFCRGRNDLDFSWDAIINYLLRYAISSIIHNGEDEEAELLAGSAKKMIDEYKVNNKLDLSKLDIEKLMKQIEADSYFSRDVKTTIVKQKLGNEMYVSLIRNFLYSKVKKEDFNTYVEQFWEKIIKNENSDNGNMFPSLLCIADMILRNENIKAVVTQNYDQFLCDALKKLMECNNKSQGEKRQYREIEPVTICDWKKDTTFKDNAFNIYHVHGFIPQYQEIQPPKGNKIVLSMDEFYEDSMNVYSWQIASQLHFLSQYTCVFCGLSLDDYTNQRLLHYVRGRHHGKFFYLTANTGNKINDRIKNEFHENNGLTVLYDEQNFGHLYNLLKKLEYEKTYN